MPQFNENVRFRKGARGQGWVTPEYFGARGLSGVDDSVAFQAAHDAMASAGGGAVLLGPKQYRTDQTIHLQYSVNWKGVPDATRWFNNHATRDHHDWTSGTHRGNYTVLEDIIFGGLLSNTGRTIFCSTGVRSLYRNCSFNVSGFSDNLNGNLLANQGANSSFVFDNCYMRATGNVDMLFQTGASSKLWLRDNTLIMPAAYTHNLVDIDDGVVRADDNYFDVTANTGATDIISLLSLGFHEFHGNEFHGTGSSCHAFAAFGGTKIVEKGSTFDEVQAYNITGGNLAQDSHLGLRAYIQGDYVTSTSVNLITLPGYRTYVVRNAATSCAITLPAGLVEGQELDLIYSTNAAVQPTFATTKVSSDAVPTIAAGNTLTGHFRWAKSVAVGVPDRWIQIGKWGVGVVQV